MRLLVATRATQRRRQRFTCVEGEMVRPTGCDCSRCAHVFAGIASGGLTSTAILADLELTRDDLTGIVRDGYAKDWGVVEQESIDGLVEDLLWPGTHDDWPTGAIFGRDGDRLLIRANGPAR